MTGLKAEEIPTAIKSRIIANVERPHEKPTDIIGFDELGKKVADAICPIIDKKEICFYDEKIQDNDVYHYLDFADMLEKTEIMIFTTDLPKKYYKSLKKLNKKVKIFLLGNLTSTIQVLTENGYKRNLVIIEI